MLLLALALAVQQGALPPVYPGLCLAAANRLEGTVAKMGSSQSAAFCAGCVR